MTLRSSTPSSLLIPSTDAQQQQSGSGGMTRPLSSSALHPPSVTTQNLNNNRHSSASLGTGTTNVSNGTNSRGGAGHGHENDTQSMVSSNVGSLASNLASLTMDEIELYSTDQRYRKYCKAIDDVLKKFESTSEWADLVQALGKLNQTIQGNLKYPVIPKRVMIGQRLAQCLNPALPSGVHLKALEAYDLIFRAIGYERIIPELTIYSNGLFPLLAHAGINVKPALLELYENHFIPLNERLRPALDGFLIAVLPAYEETTPEFARVGTLLRQCCEGVGHQYFYGSLWRCVRSNNSIRHPAITYVVNNFNKKRSLDDQIYVMGTSRETLVNAISASLADQSILVLRAALDLLLCCFPLHSQEIGREDMIKIVSAAIAVWLKRDQPLNRRLESWLWGDDVVNSSRKAAAHLPSPSSETSPTNGDPMTGLGVQSVGGTVPLQQQQQQQQATKSRKERQWERKLNYFESYSKELLIQAVVNCLSVPGNETTSPCSSLGELWPLRLFICFIDHKQFSEHVIDTVFIDVLRALQRDCEENQGLKGNYQLPSSSASSGGKTTHHKQDLLRTVNLLLSSLGIDYLWARMCSLFREASARASAASRGDPVQGLDETSLADEVPATRHKRKIPVGGGPTTVTEVCSLVEFILTLIGVESYPDMSSHYLPSFFNHVLVNLIEHCEGYSSREFTAILQLLTKMVLKMQPSSLNTTKFSKEKLTQKDSSNDVIVEESEEATSMAEEMIAPNEFEQLLTQTSYQTLVDNVQNFFNAFITKRLVHEVGSIESCYDHLTGNFVSSSSPAFSSATLISVNEKFSQVYIALCELLSNFSLIDTQNVEPAAEAIRYGNSSQHSISDSTSSLLPNTPLPPTLPFWLRDLLVLSIYVDNRSSRIAYSSIRTILELMENTRSQFSSSASSSSSVTNNNNNEKEISASSASSQKKIPIISREMLAYLNRQTNYCSLVARKLWSNLSDRMSEMHLETAELLIKLNNFTYDPHVVEKVICEDMVSTDEVKAYAARNRFITLFNISRDMTSERELDRPLCLMLDSLTHKLDLYNAQASDWLNQAMKQGDIARILEPLLLILFHPDTSRISIQHVNIHQPTEMVSSTGHAGSATAKDETDEAIAASEAKIYAISSTSGNVIYHVCKEGKKRYAGSPSKQGKVLALTSQGLVNDSSASRSGPSAVTTQTVNLPDYEIPDSIGDRSAKYGNINVVFNPFSSVSSLATDATESLANESALMSSTVSMPNLANARRMDSKWPQETSQEATSRRRSATPTVPAATDVTAGTSTPCSSLAATPQSSRRIAFGPEFLSTAHEEHYESGPSDIASLVNELVDKVAENVEPHGNDSTPDESKVSSQSSTPPGERATSNNNTFAESLSFNITSAKQLSVNQLNSYLLLYTQVYDSHRILYALTTFWNVMQADPGNVLFRMATTSISNRIGFRSQELQLLCARHKSAKFGKGFNTPLASEYLTAHRSTSFLEMMVDVCLNFISSYYPNLPQSRLTEDEIFGNQRVRIMACEILRVICSKMIHVMKGQPSFPNYLHDMMMRCKIQKIVLHSLVCSVYNFQMRDKCKASSSATAGGGLGGDGDEVFVSGLIEFNELRNNSSFQQDLQKSLLKLTQELIILENKVAPSNMTSTDKDLPTHSRKGSDSKGARIRFQPQISSLKYYPNILIPSQSMFLSAIQTALQCQHESHLMSNWLAFVEATLPYAGRSLTRIVICVVNQLCANIEEISSNLIRRQLPYENVAPNYLITQLKSLAWLCQYCIIDTSSTAPVSIQPVNPASGSSSLPIVSGPFQVLSNILHVFSSNESADSESHHQSSSNSYDPLLSAKKTVLTHLARILSSIVTTWKAATIMSKPKAGSGDERLQIVGHSKDIKNHILEFLSPVSLLHGTHFMSAVATVWYECRDSSKILTGARPAISHEQNLLMGLVAAIRVLPMESVVQTVRQVLKHPISFVKKKKIPLEVSLLQFFLAYISAFPGSQLLECWKSLLSLLKDGLNVSSSSNQPLVQFHLLAILHEFVQAAPLIEDRRDQKELQDVTQKLVDAVTNVAGARLAQTKWLRRNLEVVPGPQNEPLEEDYDDRLDSSDFAPHSPGSADEMVKSPFSETEVEMDSAILAKYSVQALCALAEYVAPILDVVFVSDETEKVVPIVSNIIYYVTPYLRTHSKDNTPSFRACSHLLSSISGYRYSRKAWKRDAFDLLLESNFFQMDDVSFGHWKVIIDHLMTHDKTSFRDFLARVSVPQPSSLKLFGGRDAEMERAHLVKRLAFILFCSEKDQYQRFLSEIQEKLIESLRVASSVIVQSQVLFCFRVLITRMSSHHLNSLWPIIYTEMVQVFLQIEMRLLKETSEFSSRMQKMPSETNWFSSPVNGFASQNHPAQLPLFLNACKLLDLSLALPADSLPQMQMYRWAFVGDCSPLEANERLPPSDLSSIGDTYSILDAASQAFDPHVVRICRLIHLSSGSPQPPEMDSLEDPPLLRRSSITAVNDLGPFFNRIMTMYCQRDQITQESSRRGVARLLDEVDRVIESDFLEPFPE